jgi:hypothetical protein
MTGSKNENSSRVSLIDLEALLDIISQTYLENDREIQMINRAMNLVSQELRTTSNRASSC